MNDVEVELRAIINDDHALAALTASRHRAGANVVRERRVLIDYSTFIEGIETRTTDIRVRTTNGVKELIVKRGSFGDEARQESSVEVAGSFRQLITTMGMMGYQKGVIAVRDIERFVVDGIEYSVQQIRPYDQPERVYGQFVEAEILTDSNGKTEAIQILRRALQSYGLTIMSSRAWYDYVRRLNDEANGVFDMAHPDWGRLDRLEYPDR